MACVDARKHPQSSATMSVAAAFGGESQRSQPAKRRASSSRKPASGGRPARDLLLNDRAP